MKFSNMEQQASEASDDLKYKINIINDKYNEKYDQQVKVINELKDTLKEGNS